MCGRDRRRDLIPEAQDSVGSSFQEGESLEHLHAEASGSKDRSGAREPRNLSFGVGYFPVGLMSDYTLG